MRPLDFHGVPQQRSPIAAGVVKESPALRARDLSELAVSASKMFSRHDAKRTKSAPSLNSARRGAPPRGT